ncbi:hypothetical protein BH23GEM1_BH23GEM1_07120 [soil metagenome]
MARYVNGGVRLALDLRIQLQEILGESYRLGRELAGGGMSRVFVAEEVELERQVVVKVLPPDLGAGLNIDRFRREIQLAAKLQHPHIVPLLAGGARGALLYYTMPFIEGESLRAKLARTRELPVHEAVKILIEIADALAYAHSHSVVHRDIKPENVLMAGKHAVVTDFGVARALSNSTGSSSLTSIGVALGTPAYMAPEQAAADPLVDHRADIYALGVIGYELLTGRTPFAGLNPQQMLSAQVTTQPDDITRYRPNVPPQLAAVIMQCLEKNPADRLQSADELRIRLESLATPSGGMPPVAGKSYARWRLTPQRIGVVAALVGLAAVALFAASSAFRGSNNALAIGNTRQITSAPGIEIHPSISPDGNTVAFVSGVPGRMSLFIRQVGGGRTVRLTEEQQGNVLWPLWSPDGSHVAFVAQSQILSIPALGGRPSVLVSRPPTAPVVNGGWAPDGNRFAYAIGDSIYVANADGTEAKRVGGRPSPHAIAWSSDGTRLAVASGDTRFLLGGAGDLGNIAASSIWIIPADGGEAVAATDEAQLRTSPVWSPDGDYLLYVSAAGGIRDIYQQRIDRRGNPRGEPVRLTTGLNPHSISLSRDGKMLSYSQFVMTSNVFALPLSARGAVGANALRPITSGNQVIESMAVSPDGQWLAFDSNLGGNQDIYKVPIGGGEVEQLTRHPADDFQPSWSPDGREISFHSFRNGDRDLFIVAADGSSTAEILRAPGHQLAAFWAPTGDAIVFTEQLSSGGSISVLERDPEDAVRWSAPRPVALSGTRAAPRWSPDGTRIAFNSLRGLMVVSSRGGQPRRLFQPTPEYPLPFSVVWTKGSERIYYMTGSAMPGLWSVSAAGGTPTRLVTFADPARQPFRFVFDADTQNFYVTIGSRESDIWVMELSNK